jgi:hypothetical protein
MSSYTEAQLRRAAAFGGHLCPGRTIRYFVHEGSGGRVSMSRQVQARCPILRTSDDADMVILPDGSEYWIGR